MYGSCIKAECSTDPNLQFEVERGLFKPFRLFLFHLQCHSELAVFECLNHECLFRRDFPPRLYAKMFLLALQSLQPIFVSTVSLLTCSELRYFEKCASTSETVARCNECGLHFALLGAAKIRDAYRQKELFFICRSKNWLNQDCGFYYLNINCKHHFYWCLANAAVKDDFNAAYFLSFLIWVSNSINLS